MAILLHPLCRSLEEEEEDTAEEEKRQSRRNRSRWRGRESISTGRGSRKKTETERKQWKRNAIYRLTENTVKRYTTKYNTAEASIFRIVLISTFIVWRPRQCNMHPGLCSKGRRRPPRPLFPLFERAWDDSNKMHRMEEEEEGRRSFWGLHPPSTSNLSEKWDNNFFCSRSREIHLVGFRSFFLPWDSFQGGEGRFFSRKTFSFKRSPPPPPYSVIVRDYPASSEGDTWDHSFSRFGKKMMQAPSELGHNYVRNIVTIPNPLALFWFFELSPLLSLVLIEFNAFSWI